MLDGDGTYMRGKREYCVYNILTSHGILSYIVYMYILSWMPCPFPHHFKDGLWASEGFHSLTSGAT